MIRFGWHPFIFLFILVVVGVVYYFAINTPSATPTNISVPTPSPITRFRINLGAEEPVFMMDLKYVPDGHISKVEENNQIKLFITAHNKTYLLKGNSFDNLFLLTDSNNNPLPILKPEGDGYEKDYAGFGSVIFNKTTEDYIGIYHAEQRMNPDASDTQVSVIALAISKDGGLTWEKKNKIITGLNELPLGTKGSGAGQPSAIIIGDYIYLYYLDINYNMPNSVHLARAYLSSNGMPGSWIKYTKEGFTSPGIGGYSDPVILPSDISGNIVYVSNPSISYNYYLKKYLAIVETNLGFYAGQSTDGINWNNFTRFLSFPKDTNFPKTIGDVWYSYPNFISASTPSDSQTSQDGYLYYSKGVFGQDHHMVRRTFSIVPY